MATRFFAFVCLMLSMLFVANIAHAQGSCLFYTVINDTKDSSTPQRQRLELYNNCQFDLVDFEFTIVSNKEYIQYWDQLQPYYNEGSGVLDIGAYYRSLNTRLYSQKTASFNFVAQPEIVQSDVQGPLI